MTLFPKDVQPARTREWYIDSGASRHMSPYKKLFGNVKSTALTKITTASDDKVDIFGIGDVKIQLNDEHINVNKVLYVPKLSSNLLSVYQMTNAGNKLFFDENGCIIYNKDDKQIMHVKPVDGIYKFRADNTKCLLATNNGDNAMTWHGSCQLH